MKLFIIMLLFLNFFGCDSTVGPESGKILSNKFSSLDEKILFLEQYINFRRSYNNLDFNISYHNNSTDAIPAPSDWDIRIVAVIPKSEINNWLSELKLSTGSIDKTWLQDIPTNIDYQYINEWYQLRNQKFVGIDRVNGIVAYRNMTY